MEISGAHRLKLPYQSKCENLHGHNWIVTVFCQSEKLNDEGMIVDFTQVKSLIMGKLDHANINEVVDFNPTAENMARWICEQVPFCYRVTVQESEGNIAEYDRQEEN